MSALLLLPTVIKNDRWAQTPRRPTRHKVRRPAGLASGSYKSVITALILNPHAFSKAMFKPVCQARPQAPNQTWQGFENTRLLTLITL